MGKIEKDRHPKHKCLNKIEDMKAVKALGLEVRVQEQCHTHSPIPEHEQCARKPLQEGRQSYNIVNRLKRLGSNDQSKRKGRQLPEGSPQSIGSLRRPKG